MEQKTLTSNARINKYPDRQCLPCYAACLLFLILTGALFCGSASAADLQVTAPISARLDADVNRFLESLAAQRVDFATCIRTIAAAYIGAPYVRHPLRDEIKDWFPYRTVDCTMFVLCVTAFANSRSVAEAREHMRLLHYKNGIIGFAHRYHFTEDRITDPANRYFSDITASCVRDPRCLRSITVELNKKKNGGYLLGERLGTWSKTVTIDYLPRQGFCTTLLQNLPPVCGIAFIKMKNRDQGLVVGHEGLLIDGDLYHASPERGVHKEIRYLERTYPSSSWDGCLFFSMHRVALPSP